MRSKATGFQGFVESRDLALGEYAFLIFVLLVESVFLRSAVGTVMTKWKEQDETILSSPQAKKRAKKRVALSAPKAATKAM